MISYKRVGNMNFFVTYRPLSRTCGRLHKSEQDLFLKMLFLRRQVCRSERSHCGRGFLCPPCTGKFILFIQSWTLKYNSVKFWEKLKEFGPVCARLLRFFWYSTLSSSHADLRKLIISRAIFHQKRASSKLSGKLLLALKAIKSGA